MKWLQNIPSLTRQCAWLSTIFLLVLLSCRPGLSGDTLLVATAANFIRPMDEIATFFAKEEGGEVNVTYGSSGKLFAQIKHGAPYDLFLSADQQRPELLHDQGLCESPFLYATGSVVLWSANQSIKAESWREVLGLTTGKIAIASPTAAPYGEKAFQALQQLDLDRQVQPRLVFGQSVGQTFLFAQAGGTELGFIALSQALSPEGLKGQYWLMPEADSVQQWGCVVTGSDKGALSHGLRLFLATETSRNIIRRYGYR